MSGHDQSTRHQSKHETSGETMHDRQSGSGGRRSRWARRAAVAAAATGALALAGSASAQAMEFESLGGSLTDAATGDAQLQAGARPDVRVKFSLPTVTRESDGRIVPEGSIRNVESVLPQGLVGNPAAFATCSRHLLVDRRESFFPGCPIDSQVGLAHVVLDGYGGVERAPVYNLERSGDSPGEFGFNVWGAIVRLVPHVRGDYAIQVDSLDSSQAKGIAGIDLTMWAVPADPIHDAERYDPDAWGGFGDFGAASSAAPAVFMTSPTSCSGDALSFDLRMSTWQNPSLFADASFSTDVDGNPMVMEGCERLVFDPSVDVRATSAKADAPTGLDVSLTVPQRNSTEALATAHVRDVTVDLPEGLSISPGSASGLAACSDAQLGMGSVAVEQCPDASKIGSVSVETPLLEEPLQGHVYVGSQLSDDPMSGKMFRIFIVAAGQGVRVKLEGAVKADPATGRLTSTFVNNPQLPFSKLDVKFFGGDQAALATSASCGTLTTNAGLTSWSGKAAGNSSTFDVDCRPGLGGFSPSFTAGSVSPVAGAFSPFVVGIGKPDGQSALDGLSVEMPKGVLAKLKGNLGSQVGSVTAYAGSGSKPYPLPGQVFLEGAYGDAPYSLRVVVPAKAGPYDLGEVVVRQKVYVDRTSAQVKVVSDPIPTIVKGVPTRLQRLDVNVDKLGFMVNPTSCEASEVKATLRSAAGQSAPLNARFQVGECASLGFSPSLAMALTGKKQVTTGKHPGIQARLRQASGQAGIGRAKVTLPAALALDPDNAQALCEFVDGTKPDLENHCPKGSIVGRARAKTPLLERDLVGDVYFVKNVRKDAKTGNEIRTLPMIVVALRGEIAINLRGEASTTKAGRLVSTFANVPDAPISAFNLNIKGGSNGILAVTRTRKARINLCAKPTSHRAAVDLDGHNGRDADFNTTVKTPCGKTKAAKKAKGGKK
jgi:hypothetical protein